MDRNKKAIKEIKEKHKKKIIIYGAPCHMLTGNGKLVYNMAKAFQEGGHQVYTIGIEYNKLQIWHDNIPIMPSFHCERCGNAYKGSSESVQKIADYINGLKPDFFICVGDPYQMQQFGIGNLDFSKIKTKAIMYATIDSIGVFTNKVLSMSGKRDYLELCDKVISTAKFTKNQIEEWTNINSEVIYETINLDNYFPVDEKTKKVLKKRYRFKENDFVMYYAGRNIIRKRHNILLDACAKFLCETKDTYLYLNIPPSVAQDGSAYYPDVLNPIDFVKRVLKKKYGRDLAEEGRILFVGRGGLGSTSINEQQNAELYRLSDLYVTACANEGFGLTPVESLACGVPAVIPIGTTGKEIIGYTADSNTGGNYEYGMGGLLTECPNTQWVEYGLKQELTNAGAIYDAIKTMYKKPELRKELGIEGRKYVEKMFNFEDFKNKWLKVIQTTEKKPKEEFKSLEIKTEEQKK